MLVVALSAAAFACHRDSTTTTVTSSPDPRTIPDADIAAALTRHLNEDAVLRPASVAVSVTNGICTLTGSVGSILEKERAVQVAETLRGIRAIIDRIDVSPSNRTDDEIKHDVESALRRERVTRKHPAVVSVNAGVVTLTGQTASWTDRTFAGDLAKTAAGVRAVENGITIKSAVVPTDEAIASTAKERIRDDLWLDGSTIDVTAVGRTIRLAGTVGSVADKSRARDDAWSAGAEMVEDDGLVVDWAKRDDQRARTDEPYRTDDEIASAVREALTLDPRLEAIEPKVTVQDRVVSLTGVVDGLSAKRAAILDATNTIGVASIRNHLVIQPTVRAHDADLTRAVEQALAADGFLSDAAKTIHASTVKGRVRLEGSTDSVQKRSAAFEDAAAIPGVLEVDDAITVDRTPSDIKSAIDERIYWDARVQRDRITVRVGNDGTATLEGTLDDASEMRAAVDDATLAGAPHVINLLQARPGAIR